jgi:molybdate/tungstate transport system substrate-binding protein
MGARQNGDKARHFPLDVSGDRDKTLRRVPSCPVLAGGDFQGHANGSKALAMQIKEGSLVGDVFISADPKMNAALSGPTNGDRVKWYVTFAESPLVLGVSPSSRFAAEVKGKPWDEVLKQPGAKIGRTDPAKDPKGGLLNF